MLQYLIRTFGYNQPFTISEVEYKNFSRTWKYNCITKLCEKGDVVHLERDVYYVMPAVGMVLNGSLFVLYFVLYLMGTAIV